jgi:hypothetical protein
MIPTSLAGVLIIAAGVNGLCYYLFHFPIVYCAGVWAAHELMPWVDSVRIILCALTVAGYIYNYWEGARPFALTWAYYEVILFIGVSVFSFGVTCNSHPTASPPLKSPQVVEKVEEPSKSSAAVVSKEPTIVAKLEPPRRISPPSKGHGDAWLKFDTSPMVSSRERALASRELY